MQNKVQINPDEMGNVIRVSKNNSEFGHIRLTQERVSFGNTGWVNRKQLSTLLHGKVEDLREMGIQNMEQLIIAWLMAHPSGIIPVIGSGKMKHVKSAIVSTEKELSREDWFRIFIAATGQELP